MTEEKIARINALAQLAKTRALTAEELAERDVLRREYIDSVKASLTAHLDNSYIKKENGEIEKLQKKEE